MKFVTPLLLLLASTTTSTLVSGFVVNNNRTPTTRSSSASSSSRLFLGYRSRVDDAIADAEEICRIDGPQSEACRVAWDIVEDMEAMDGGPYNRNRGRGEDRYLPVDERQRRRNSAYDYPNNALPPAYAPPNMMAGVPVGGGLGDGDISTAKDISALLEGFDILADDLDRNLNQLIATTDRLMELGDPYPPMDELGPRAIEMKRLLIDVRRYLDQQ